MAQPIHVVDGARTPFLKARNRPGPFAAAESDYVYLLMPVRLPG